MASHLRVRSEHCMGMLKGRWQSLRGLRVKINSKTEHVAACRWITVAIILHNLVIDVEGDDAAEHFANLHQQREELNDRGAVDEPLFDGDHDDDEAKRRQLVAELMAYRAMQN
jgi:hypothetical protein